jgi:N-acyl-D-aspartate/D-glutamate deacylase
MQLCNVGDGIVRQPQDHFLHLQVAEIAKLRGDKDPADMCFNLILEEGNYIAGIYHNMSEDDVRQVLKLPWVAIASVLREGAWADVVVFDPKTVDDTATFERPKQCPLGIDQVIVNGVAVIENGTHTGAKPGKVVFGSAYTGKS